VPMATMLLVHTGILVLLAKLAPLAHLAARGTMAPLGLLAPAALLVPAELQVQLHRTDRQDPSESMVRMVLLGPRASPELLECRVHQERQARWERTARMERADRLDLLARFTPRIQRSFAFPVSCMSV